MPGGFCRIAEQLDARAVSMGDGARAADVWVVSDKAVSTDDPAAGGRHGADQAHRRLGAEPGRRQPVLARPLSRARRGDVAADAGAGDSPRDPGKGSSTALHSVERIQRLLVAWGATSQVGAGAAGEDRGRSAAKRGAVWLGVVAGARGAAHRDVAARTAVAGCLAGHHRDDRAAGAGSRGRRRRRQRRRTDVAGTGEFCRARAGKHEPRRRLALPRNGPPRRARDQHGALRPPVRL